jgi:hypothetical protein
VQRRRPRLDDGRSTLVPGRIGGVVAPGARLVANDHVALVGGESVSGGGLVDWLGVGSGLVRRPGDPARA